ncbi:tRNA-binding protein [Streptomyces sp. ODS28]|uniref:tRNA-binding protein n=1 Tax=Streptomyces sp. ODS28 TaxID=3136688 RepID=UPI0031E89243
MTSGYADFEAFRSVDLRVGTVVSAAPNAKARTPAYVLEIDLGELGVRTSSAQITDLYAAEDLPGRQVLCACNFAPKRVAGVKSEVLVLGAYDAANRVTLAGFDHPVPNGTPLQ